MTDKRTDDGALFNTMTSFIRFRRYVIARKYDRLQGTAFTLNSASYPDVKIPSCIDENEIYFIHLIDKYLNK